MDPVAELFSSLPDPDVDRVGRLEQLNLQIRAALMAFVENTKEPNTPEWAHLYDQARITLAAKGPGIKYFRQQLASYALTHAPNRKDKGPRATQLRYYKWIAQGRKSETYPFPQGRYFGLASTLRLSQIAKPSTLFNVCSACGKEGGVNMRCPGCNLTNEKFVLEATAYCNKTCFQNHQAAHKQVCQGRKLIFRLAKLLDAMFIKMLETTFYHPMCAVKEAHGLIYINSGEWDKVAMTGRPLFTPFREDLTVGRNQDAKKESLRAGKSLQRKAHPHLDPGLCVSTILSYGAWKDASPHHIPLQTLSKGRMCH
jgi:hypothetical protein